MMRKTILAVAAAVLAATPAYAAHWNVDYAKSRLGFSVMWSGEPFSANFKAWKADIDFDPTAAHLAHVTVAIDLASEASDETDFDDGLKGAQGFQVSQFPVARFTTTTFAHEIGTEYVATGNLTLKGVTREVILPFSLTINGNTAHMKGTAHVIRTDFGVGLGSWTAPSPVAHEVTVNIDLTATKQ
jgi:polyisoprenoid-binding protein YceI